MMIFLGILIASLGLWFFCFYFKNRKCTGEARGVITSIFTEPRRLKFLQDKKVCLVKYTVLGREYESKPKGLPAKLPVEGKNIEVYYDPLRPQNMVLIRYASKTLFIGAIYVTLLGGLMVVCHFAKQLGMEDVDYMIYAFLCLSCVMLSPVSLAIGIQCLRGNPPQHILRPKGWEKEKDIESRIFWEGLRHICWSICIFLISVSNAVDLFYQYLYIDGTWEGKIAYWDAMDAFPWGIIRLVAMLVILLFHLFVNYMIKDENAVE